MKIKILVVLLAVASIFAACKKDENGRQPEVNLPEGQYRLVKAVHYDNEGKDSATVNLPLSTLKLSFDQKKNTANLAGIADTVSITGTYNASVNGTLGNASIVTARQAATPNDLMVIGLLQKGTNFEGNMVTVRIKAKDHGYLVFSSQK